MPWVNARSAAGSLLRAARSVTFDVAFRSAPLLASSVSTAARFDAAANIAAVSSRTGSFALTLAPPSISSFTASVFPDADASISAVVPLLVALFASAPDFSSGAMTDPLPFFAARMSGVYAPIRVVARTLAPANSSVWTRSASSFIAAQWSAVMPSPWAALTSAACFSSDRTASLLPCIAASATGALGAAWISDRQCEGGHHASIEASESVS